MAEEKNPMQLLAERDKIFKDFYTNITPERMPLIASVQPVALSGYCGLDLHEWHYNSTVLQPAMEEVAKKVYSDVNPFMPPVLIARPATSYQILGSQSFVMAKNGLVQHPRLLECLPRSIRI